MFSRPMQTTYYTKKQKRTSKSEEKEDKMVRLVIMPHRSLKSYFLDITWSQINQAVQSSCPTPTNTDLLTKIELYSKKLNKYPSLLYSHYGLSPPAYSIIYRQTAKISAGMYILYTIEFTPSMSLHLLRVYLPFLQKGFHFRLSKHRFQMF